MFHEFVLCLVRVSRVSRQEMKRKGIFGLASFLDHSDSLTILWSRRVFTRLWCAFEIATFLRHDREKPIEMMPVRLSMLYFLLVIVTQDLRISTLQNVCV